MHFRILGKRIHRRKQTLLIIFYCLEMTSYGISWYFFPVSSLCRYVKKNWYVLLFHLTLYCDIKNPSPTSSFRTALYSVMWIQLIEVEVQVWKVHPLAVVLRLEWIGMLTRSAADR